MAEVKSLYIHIPFCISKCKYCDFFSVPCKKNHNHYVSNDYVIALCNEIIYRINQYNIKSLDTIYIGGGTPSLLNPDQLYTIFDIIRNNTHIDDNCEITIEANPDDITDVLINSWQQVGINRISLGIQSFDDGALSYVARRASADVNIKALQDLRKRWSGILSVDFISGLPNQSSSSFLNDLDYIMTFNPQHISMYSLTIEEETPLGQEYSNGLLKYDFDFADELWLSAKEFLKTQGYNHYEVSNFALPGYECRHNLKYWNHESYVGCGSGGAGTVYKEDGTGGRWTNVQNIEKYTSFWLKNNKPESVLIPQNYEDISFNISVFEFFMMGMRKLSGVTDKRFYDVFGCNIPEKILKIMDKWNNKKMLNIVYENKITKYSLGHEGIIYLNSFLEDLL